MTKGTLSEPSKPFLVDNKELGREFRDLFLKRLSKKIEQGIIVPVDAVQIATIINELSTIDWVVFVQGPPKRKSYKATVTRLLEAGRIEVAKTFEEAESTAATKSEQPKRNCPCCEGELVVVSQAERPKWRELFYGPTATGPDQPRVTSPQLAVDTNRKKQPNPYGPQ